MPLRGRGTTRGGSEGGRAGELNLRRLRASVRGLLGQPVKAAVSGQLIIGTGKEMDHVEAASYLERSKEATRLEAVRKGLVCAKEYNGVALYEGTVREELKEVKRMALDPETYAIGWVEEGYGELDLGAAGPQRGAQQGAQQRRLQHRSTQQGAAQQERARREAQRGAQQGAQHMHLREGRARQGAQQGAQQVRA